MAQLLGEVADCCCRSAIGLTDLDQVAVGVTQIAADLGSAVDRRGQELRGAGAPVRVDGGAVRDAGLWGRADPDPGRGGLAGRRGFFVRRVRAGGYDYPAVFPYDDRRCG